MKFTDNENKTNCYPDLCKKYDNNDTPIIEECNSVGKCSFDAFR